MLNDKSNTKSAINSIYSWNIGRESLPYFIMFIHFSQVGLLTMKARIMQRFQGEMLSGGIEKGANQSCCLVRQNWMLLGD
jgi:hypothetical protein